MTDLNCTETQLLLACVRRTVPPEDYARVNALLDQQLDWTFLLTEARRHSVLPLLCRGLQRFETPPAVSELLREACRRSQRRNLAVTSELFRILRVFQTAGISAVPFKGPVLAALAYGDLSLRIFGDLDLLVPEPELRRAREALVAEGYVPEFTFTPEQETAYLKTECAIQLRHPGRDVVVELHWLLTERYLSIQLPAGQFRGRLEPVVVAGRPVLTFAAEDLLLYLFVHGSKHRWERLEWICSLAELIASHKGIDWVEVKRRAREAGIQRLLHLGLLLADMLVQLEIPAEVLPELAKDRAAQRLAREISVSMFQAGSHGERNRGGWYFYLLRSRERWRDRARIVVFSCVRQPHPSSEELVTLPAQLSFLYFLFRPARLLSASVAAACRYCMKRGSALPYLLRGRPANRKHSQSVCTR